jgi:hypothetical protein
LLRELSDCFANASTAATKGAIIENKRLGAALALIREERLRREPGRRSDRAPRRRDQQNPRLFKVGSIQISRFLLLAVQNEVRAGRRRVRRKIGRKAYPVI